MSGLADVPRIPQIAGAAINDPSRPRLYLSADEIAACPGSIPSLDGLRALSILLVLLSHYAILPHVVSLGRFGVLVFFAISGFLITRLLFVEMKTSFRVNLTQFYARRVLRLYPVIIAYTAVVIAIFIILARPIHWIEPMSAMFYFANYLDAYYIRNNFDTQMPFAHFWSLSIEEHFYLLFPVSFAILVGGIRKVTLFLIAVCLTCLGLRLITAYLHPDYLGGFYFFLPSQFRLDSIAYGVLLAVACETDRGRRMIRTFANPAIVFAALLLLLVAFGIRSEWFRATFQFSMLSIAVVVLMAAIMFSDRYRYLQIVLNLPLIKWIGVLSYSLYVWHYLVVFMLWQSMPGGSNFQMTSIGFSLSFVLAAISYYAIEKPFIRMRHRFGSRTIR